MRTWIIITAMLGAVGLGFTAEDSKPVQDETYVVVQNNRRDPFTAFKIVPKMPETPQTGNVSGNEEPISNGLSAEQIAAKREEAKGQLFYSESWLIDVPEKSIEFADKGLAALNGIELQHYPDLTEIRDALLRARKAAVSLKQERDVWREFAGMNPRVSGIVARPQHSQAIINGKIVGVGENVDLGGDNTAIVTSIVPQMVVVTYRGYKFDMEVKN